MDDGGAAQLAVEWMLGGVYDRVERRWGRVAALVVSLSLAIALLAVVLGAAWYFLFS